MGISVDSNLGTLAIKSKVGVLRPVHQPESFWDRSSALSLLEVGPTQMPACDYMPNLLTHYTNEDLI